MTPPRGRAPALGTRGMVTSPCAPASFAGAKLLASGGTAADAGVAMASTIAVAYSHMNGIGGDAFFIYYDAERRKATAYNGSGAAASLATPAWYESRGLAGIPESGGPAALTVPGAIDAWFALHERAATREVGALLADAIELAENGVPVPRSMARALAEERTLLEGDAGARAVYCARPHWREGDLLVQPALAKTLRAVAANGRGWLYGGPGAAAAAAYLAAIDSPLRAEDFAAHHGVWCEPLSGRYAGRTSLVTRPNSQGMALLLAQATLEAFSPGLDMEDMSAPFVHAAVEATRLAFAERDAWVGDPDGPVPPWERLLSPRHAESAAARIDPNRVTPLPEAVAAPGGTIYFGCVDERGNALSYIQSLYFHYGARVVVPALGMTMQNRGSSFELASGSPRSLAPGRRPFHTLMTAMLLDDTGAPELVYGTMGGEGQPQTTLALSTRIAAFGLDPQTAIERPRWRYGRTWGAPVPGVAVERGMGEACVAGLKARGHHVTIVDDFSEPMGHAGAIAIDRKRGVMTGGADPRGDGVAIGI